ncbi:MAG: ATP-dependent 6-phosphofructokinase, partial [Clostridia bacterium]|nr:ATP-dependent 6-phosphofructokinase [Clostridia bacterium]
MSEIKRIGVLTSGGDAPGMNAAVRAVVRTAITRGVEVMAIYRGYSGLIEGDIKPMQVRDVSNVINKGGTILYSDRCPEFKYPEVRAKAIENCRKLGIEGIICIGGDGTFQGATKLTAEGIPCIGIPATIDNDITSTDNTIGFDTAMNTVIDLVDKLRDTCESHARCNVVEVMGRGAGDIALNTAIALGATAVVVPEFPHDDNSICKKIKKAREIGKRSFIVIVS